MQKAASKDCLRRAEKIPADTVLTPDSHLFVPVLPLFLHKVVGADKKLILDNLPSARACLPLHKAVETDRGQTPDNRPFVPACSPLHKAVEANKGQTPDNGPFVLAPLPLPNRAAEEDKSSVLSFHRWHFLGDDTMKLSAGIEGDSWQNDLPEGAPRWYHPVQAAGSVDWCFRNDHHNRFPALLRPPSPLR